MATDLEKKVVSLTQKWSEIKVGGADLEQQVQQLTDIAAEIGLQSYVGWVAFAGRGSGGTFHVQFNVPGMGYSSSWPEWAYEPAKESLLHNKKLWVLSNGVPFGSNLVQNLYPSAKHLVLWEW